MKEYSILIICNGGKPYLSGTYNNYRDCYNSLEILTSILIYDINNLSNVELLREGDLVLIYY